MTTDDHVDANALGGALIELFGREMTDAMSCCAGCGAVNRLERSSCTTGRQAAWCDVRAVAPLSSSPSSDRRVCGSTSPRCAGWRRFWHRCLELNDGLSSRVAATDRRHVCVLA
jgi:hypothetical protein